MFNVGAAFFAIPETFISSTLSGVYSSAQTGIGSAPPAGDEYFSNVQLLLRGEGSNGSTIITDSSSYSRTLSRYGDTQISTAHFKYGTGSIYFDGSGDYLLGTNAPYNIQGVPFTIECWARLPVVSGQHIIASNYGGSTVGWTIQIVDGKFVFNYAGDPSILSTTTLSTDTWYHLAVSGVSGNIKLFVNGVHEATCTASTSMNTAEVLAIGRLPIYDGIYMFGFLDDFRITTGVSRYSTNFTPSVIP